MQGGLPAPGAPLRPLLATALFLLPGCVPLIFPFPPPSMNAASLDPVPEGEVELAGAASAIWATSALDEAPMENVYGSTFTGSAAVGLPHDIDVTLTVGRHALGPTFGATAAWWPARNPTLDLGVTLGLAGSQAETTHRLEAGTDEDGEPIYEDASLTYGTLAPSLGGRLVWKPAPVVSIPVALRGSYSWTLVPGDPDSPNTAWVEGMTGAIVHITPRFELGAGVGVLMLPELAPEGTILTGSLSVGGSFGVGGGK